jgi:hypothetical protein
MITASTCEIPPIFPFPTQLRVTKHTRVARGPLCVMREPRLGHPLHHRPRRHVHLHGHLRRQCHRVCVCVCLCVCFTREPGWSCCSFKLLPWQHQPPVPGLLRSLSPPVPTLCLVSLGSAATSASAPPATFFGPLTAATYARAPHSPTDTM